MTSIGARNSITDVPGLLVGCAEDARIMTGVTVLVPERRAPCAVSVLGGGPGTRETDALQPENLVDAVDALVLSGGSVYGLGAADAVVAAMGAEGKGFGFPHMPNTPTAPVIPAAILFDLANGGEKNWGDAPPYAALGRDAYQTRGLDVPLGNAGAGMGALAGTLKGGQGSASFVSSDGVTVGALACVNSWGSVIMPNSSCFWAWPLEQDSEFGGVRPTGENVELEDWGLSKIDAAPRANTTLAVVAVDAALTPAELKRVAQMASAGFARAIRPVFAPFDGDVVFALSVGNKPLAEPRAFAIAKLGAIAADCLARAVARGVYEAEAACGRPAWREL
jgi:L-aminopeptidase/D-esterase-like protein